MQASPVRCALAFVLAAAALAPLPAAQCEIDQIFAPFVPPGGAALGRAVSLSADRALVAAPPQASPGGSGGAFVFIKIPGQGWVLEAPLQPPDLLLPNELGAGVALDGSVAVVGNPADASFGIESGAVYVFQRSGSSWFQTAKLHALDAHLGARFGAAVALSGERLIVGAPGATGAGGLPGVGAAYVFQQLGFGAWAQVVKVVDPLGGSGDQAGSAVSLSGTRALVGAPGHDQFAFDGGAVYTVEEAAPGSWLATGKLGPPNPAPLDRFGAAVAVDGSLAAIGAPGKSDLCLDCGAAYLYASGGPGIWIEVLQLGLDGFVDGELDASDGFGSAVALSGEHLAVSAPANTDGGIASGSVYVYKLGVAGFVKTNKLNACLPHANDLFGWALDLDGATLLIGAPGVDELTFNGGSAYFFSPEVIGIENDEVGLFFSEPLLAASVEEGVPPGDPQCAEAPLFPRVEIEDRIDENPLFLGHRYVLNGHLWEMSLIEHPLPAGFAFSGYDPSVEEELFQALPADCSPEVGFDVQYDHVDPETGLAGTLVTFVWTACEAQRGVELRGPFDVMLTAFLPQGAGRARFDLRAWSSGLPGDWAFWCGKLNLSLVEDHRSDPEAVYSLLTPFGHLVQDPALNLVGNPAQNIPPRADALGRPSNQTIGLYDQLGRGFYSSMSDTTGNRAKNFQFYGCPGDGATDPTLNIVSLSYQDDVSPGADFHAVPSILGRFRGDWYDLTAVYRIWLDEEAEFTVNGLVQDRLDVPQFAKRLQMGAVLAPGVVSYFETAPAPPGGPGPLSPGASAGWPAIRPYAHKVRSVPDRLEEYMEHWDLDRLITLQFGSSWAQGGCTGLGEYVPTQQFFTNAQAMQQKEDALAAQGKELKYMVYFNDVLYSTSGTSLDWEALAIHDPAGNPLVIAPPGCGTLAFIDPSTPEWQGHMYNVALGLGLHGVDGVYCDNAFPELYAYDFTTTHGHAPGFGPYMTRGFADMFQELQSGGAAGNPGADPDFITYTEFFFEGFIPRSDTYGPEQASTDWMTADASTVQVPLISTLYHHYTVLGPPFVGYFTHDSPPFNQPNHVLNLFSAAERAKGRRGANYAMAYGWANGCSIWSPDPALTDPLHKRFSFELQEADFSLPPGTFDALRSVCDFGAELARARGFPLAEPFLTVGRRQRDLFPFSTTPPTTSVVLAPVFNPYAPGGPLIGPETEALPPIVQGVWRDPQTGYAGIALANYTNASAFATFTFDPAEYGLAGALSAYVVSASGESLHTGPFTGPKDFSLLLGAESTLFLRIHP